MATYCARSSRVILARASQVICWEGATLQSTRCVAVCGCESRRVHVYFIYGDNMYVCLNQRTENNVTIIEFIDHFGNKIGQLIYEIINDKAVIHDTYIYPDYRKKGILKSYLPILISKVKRHRVTSINLSILSEEARIAWTHLGFTETRHNFFTMNL